MDEMLLNSSQSEITSSISSDMEIPLVQSQNEPRANVHANVNAMDNNYLNYPTMQLSPPPITLPPHNNDHRFARKFPQPQGNYNGKEIGGVIPSSQSHQGQGLSPTNSNNSTLIFFGESESRSNPPPPPTDQFYLSSSNNSPFQSAAEDQDQDPDEDGEVAQDEDVHNDRDPLIFKGPPRQSVFHQFLSSAKGAVKGVGVGVGGSRDRSKKEVQAGNGGGKSGLWSNRRLRQEGGGGGHPILHPQQKHASNFEISGSIQQPKFDGCLHTLDEEDSPYCYSEEEEVGDQIQPRRHRDYNHHHHHHRSKSDQHPPSNSNIDLQPRGTSCSIGILLAAVSCVFFATSALIVKVSRLHPMQLLCVRGSLQALFISPILASSGNSFLGPTGSRALLLARAVLGAVSLIMSFASIHLIPLADAATCIFTSPVFVSLFACICLGELCTWFDVVMILLTLLGVVLVSQPSFHFLTLWSSGSEDSSWTSILGTICGLFAAMLTALAFIVLRQLKHVHYSVVVFWFSAVLAGFGGVLMIALDGFRIPEDAWDWLDCVGIGICGFLGQILLTKALQIENAGPCAVARTLDIVLAFFYQITLLHDTPDWSSYLGSFLVVSCVLLTAFRRWYREKYGLERDVRSHNGALDGDGELPTGGSARRGKKSGCGINIRNCTYTRANTAVS